MSRVSSWMPRVVKSWNESAAALRPGVTMRDIERFERSFGVRLSEDVADYFRWVDGINEGEWDEHLIRFWPLDEVRPVLQEVPDASKRFRGYFVFADYCLWAHGYAVRLGSDEDDVVIAGAGRTNPGAPSFAGFLELYVTNPEGLFLHAAPRDGETER
jgi:hypothetical protein